MCWIRGDYSGLVNVREIGLVNLGKIYICPGDPAWVHTNSPNDSRQIADMGVDKQARLERMIFFQFLFPRLRCLTQLCPDLQQPTTDKPSNWHGTSKRPAYTESLPAQLTPPCRFVFHALKACYGPCLPDEVYQVPHSSGWRARRASDKLNLHAVLREGSSRHTSMR